MGVGEQLRGATLCCIILNIIFSGTNKWLPAFSLMFHVFILTELLLVYVNLITSQIPGRGKGYVQTPQSPFFRSVHGLLKWIWCSKRHVLILYLFLQGAHTIHPLIQIDSRCDWILTAWQLCIMYHRVLCLWFLSFIIMLSYIYM